MMPLEVAVEATTAAFDWNALVTPVFTLLGAVGGAALTTILGGRQRREERAHELVIANQQRYDEASAGRIERRRDAYLGLVRAIHETTQRHNEREHPPAGQFAASGIFDFNDLVLAAGLVQMAVPEDEGFKVQGIIEAFTQRYFRDPGIARDDVLRVYRTHPADPLP